MSFFLSESQPDRLLEGFHMKTSIEGRICSAQRHFWTQCMQSSIQATQSSGVLFVDESKDQMFTESGQMWSGHELRVECRLPGGSCQQQPCVVWPWKKQLYAVFFFFFFLLRFLFQDCVSFSSLIVVILFLGFLSHRHFTKLPTRSAEKDLFLLIIIKGICVCSTLSAWGVTAIITISKNNMSLLEGFHYQQHKQNKNIKSDRRLKGTVQRKLVINYRTPCCWRVGWSVVTFLELHSKNSVAAFS